MRKKSSENKKEDIENRLVKYYNELTELEKQELIKHLKQDKSSLESRLKEKQGIIDYLQKQVIMND